MKPFYEKLKYRLLVERSKIKNASFLNKTAISENKVKTNRMVSTKCTYHKKRSFASNYFIFLKVLFFRTFYKELICCTKEQNANTRISKS